jgi:hypothetical protein
MWALYRKRLAAFVTTSCTMRSEIRWTSLREIQTLHWWLQHGAWYHLQCSSHQLGASRAIIENVALNTNVIPCRYLLVWCLLNPPESWKCLPQASVPLHTVPPHMRLPHEWSTCEVALWMSGQMGKLSWVEGRRAWFLPCPQNVWILLAAVRGRLLEIFAESSCTQYWNHKSPICPHCSEAVPESPTHLACVCPKFREARTSAHNHVLNVITSLLSNNVGPTWKMY